ncbi:MAG: hypothetical protein ABWY23_02515, partial [Mycetocola sp.]
MTNPQTPQYPEGTPAVPGDASQQPAFAPQQPPFAPQQHGAQPGGYPPFDQYQQQPPQGYQQPPQGYQQQGQYAQQPYPQQYAPVRPPRPQRPARPKTDPNGVPYGIGGFTLREVLFLGTTAIVLIASFLPFLGGDYADVFGYTSVWAPAPWLAIPAVLVLVAAAVLLAVRRLAPARPLRVGSLSVDQYASVASVVTAGFYLGALFLIIGFPAWFGGGSDLLVPGAGVIVGLLFSLLAVVLTTLAPVIPLFAGDFSGRRETGAHRVARPAGLVPRRPRVERPAAPQQPVAYPGQPGAPLRPAGPGEYAAYQRRGSQPTPAPQDPGAQAFPIAGADAPEPATPQAVQQSSAETVTDSTAPVTVEPEVAPIEVTPDALVEPDAPVDPDAPAEPGELAVAPDDSAPEPSDPGQDLSRDQAHPHEDAQPLDPAFVAADVPAVDPGASVTATQVIDAHEDLDDDDDEAGPAPVSAFSHVSSRSAAGVDEGTEQLAAGEQAAESPTTVFSTQPFWVYSPVPRQVIDEQTGVTV